MSLAALPEKSDDRDGTRLCSSCEGPVLPEMLPWGRGVTGAGHQPKPSYAGSNQTCSFPTLIHLSQRAVNVLDRAALTIPLRAAGGD